MTLDYFDMLSGDPIFVEGVGHVRSPKLREICPSGIGYRLYHTLLSFLSWNKEQLLEYDKMRQVRGVGKLENPKLEFFDAATLIEATRAFCYEALSFFVVEKLHWDDTGRRFVTIDTVDGETTVIGEISRKNFEDVKQVILQLNFIGLDKETAPVKHSSETSKALWDRVQKHLKEQSEKRASESKPEYRISNIISKLCAVHPSYNLLNVFDLTVFQMYDAFFQVGYMRSADLSERVFSNHGGDKFKFEDWLKPILQHI